MGPIEGDRRHAAEPAAEDATGAAIGEAGRRASVATVDRVVERVDVAHGRQGRDPEAELPRAARPGGPGVGRLIGTPRNTAVGLGAGRSPTSRRRRPGPARRRSRPRASAAAAWSSKPGVTCGVSMPICRPGPPISAHAAAAARRSADRVAGRPRRRREPRSWPAVEREDDRGRHRAATPRRACRRRRPRRERPPPPACTAGTGGSSPGPPRAPSPSRGRAWRSTVRTDCVGPVASSCLRDR